jgi:hypothetical protein
VPSGVIVCAGFANAAPDGDVAPPSRAKLALNSRAVSRTAFAASLWRIGRDAAVVPVLIDLIREDDFLARAGAFSVLEKIRPEATAATSLLVEMLGHKHRLMG